MLGLLLLVKDSATSNAFGIVTPRSPKYYKKSMNRRLSVGSQCDPTRGQGGLYESDDRGKPFGFRCLCLRDFCQWRMWMQVSASNLRLLTKNRCTSAWQCTAWWHVQQFLIFLRKAPALPLQKLAGGWRYSTGAANQFVFPVSSVDRQSPWSHWLAACVFFLRRNGRTNWTHKTW